jgi:AcrR family transcriptional regulator
MRAPRRTQEERSAESARRLRDAAIELIGKQGYERTTAAQISERAGYSRPMVRTRYGSKQQLLESILSIEYDGRVLAAVADDRGLDGRARLLAQAGRLVQMAEEAPQLLRSFLVLSFETAGPVGELRPWLRGFLDRYAGELADAVRTGQRDGSIASDADPESEADWLIGAGIGQAFLALVSPAPEEVARRLQSWHCEIDRRLRP